MISWHVMSHEAARGFHRLLVKGVHIIILLERYEGFGGKMSPFRGQLPLASDICTRGLERVNDCPTQVRVAGPKFKLATD